MSAIYAAAPVTEDLELFLITPERTGTFRSLVDRIRKQWRRDSHQGPAALEVRLCVERRGGRAPLFPDRRFPLLKITRLCGLAWVRAGVIDHEVQICETKAMKRWAASGDPLIPTGSLDERMIVEELADEVIGQEGARGVLVTWLALMPWGPS